MIHSSMKKAQNKLAEIVSITENWREVLNLNLQISKFETFLDIKYLQLVSLFFL